MFDELEEYLSHTTSPERASILMEAARLLFDAGVRAHESDIERVLRMADQFTTDDNIFDLFSLLTNYSERTIASFGLIISDEIPLGCQNHILSGLLTFENYGDPDFLLGILQKEEDIETKVSDLLDAVTPLNWANFAPYIDHVSDALLLRIEEVATENLPVEEERKDLSPFRDRLKRHTDKNGEGKAVELIRQGVTLGSAIETFLEEAEATLGDLEAQPDALAKELVGLALASGLPDNELRVMVSELVEDFARDINIVTKANDAAIKYLLNAIEVKS